MKKLGAIVAALGLWLAVGAAAVRAQEAVPTYPVSVPVEKSHPPIVVPACCTASAPSCTPSAPAPCVSCMSCQPRCREGCIAKLCRWLSYKAKPVPCDCKCSCCSGCDCCCPVHLYEYFPCLGRGCYSSGGCTNGSCATGGCQR